MDPHIRLHGLAILASVVASWVVGGIWYGPLLGKAWVKAQGFPADFKPSGAEMRRGMALNLLGTLLMAFVLAHSTEVWHASVWGLGPDKAPYVYGFFAGFFTWLGFIVPMLLNAVAFERKSWKLFAINAAYQLVSLQIMGMILCYWR